MKMLLITLVTLLVSCAHQSPQTPAKNGRSLASESLRCTGGGLEDFEGFEFVLEIKDQAERVSDDLAAQIFSGETPSEASLALMREHHQVFINGLENEMYFLKNDVAQTSGDGLRLDCTGTIANKPNRKHFIINQPAQRRLVGQGEGDSYYSRASYIFSYNPRSKQGILCMTRDHDGALPKPIIPGRLYNCE